MKDTVSDPDGVLEDDFNPVWRDLDDHFNDPENFTTELVFDQLVARQAESGHNLSSLCPEAQQLLDQWNIDDNFDYLPEWKAAVDRRQPEMFNDAHILGASTPELEELMNQPAGLMIGELWGLKDRRNTQDGQWKAVEMPWRNWIIGHEGDANNAAWGFSRHPVGKHKEGSSVVLGTGIDGARKAKAMETMYAIGLDIDSGARLQDVLKVIQKKGLFALVYTSFNNGKQGLTLKRDEVLRKLKITSDPDIHQVRQYLREHDKNRYEESFIAEIEIAKQKHQEKDGVKIILDTPPLEKFRLIFPLAEPVQLIDLAQTHQEALDIWENKITGMAVEVLGVHFDTSCTDPSRLFYTARHAKGDDNFYAAMVQGTPLRFEDVPEYKKSLYTSKREKLNAFELAGGGDMDGDRPPMAMTPSGKSLNDWHVKAKDRFLIANLLEDMCPDRIRVAGGEAEGHVHIECPFEHEHSSEGGTATMAINCIDSQNEFWTIFCRHDACQGRHKLQFLEQMLRQGWFEESLLFDEDSPYLLPPEDEPEEDVPAEPAYEGDKIKTPMERAEEYNSDSTEEGIRKFFKRLFCEGVDLTTRANITALLAKNTALGRRELKKFWTDLDKEQRDKDRKRAQEGDIAESGVAMINEWDFENLCEYGDRRIKDENQNHPFMFHYMHDLCIIRAGSDGRYAIRVLNKDGFSHVLNSVGRFAKSVGDDGGKISVSAPYDVVNYLYAADYDSYPKLRGIVTTPSFMESGSLLSKEGYDWDSRLYYKPDNTLSFPAVSDVPTEDEVFEAKRMLVQEILADFMLEGKTRAETIRDVLCCTEVDGELEVISGAEPQSAPSVAHAIVMALFPFVREMIPGNAAGVAIDKQKPGAGAGKLEAAMSTIYAGRATPAMALPTNPDEMSKVLLPVLRNGAPNVFFDNINHSVDSGELASAMTAPIYAARVLGSSETVDVEVRCQWVVAGNKLSLSDELTRRFVLIYLDPKTATPEQRSGFRHTDLEAWVHENRGKLIWACLTLIQNWIACGRQPGTKNKASYTQWAGIMGGILEAAGIKGFLENEQDMKARSTARDTPVSRFVERLSALEGGTHFVSGKVAKRHPKGTQSIKDILEHFHEDEIGETKALRVNGWGYDTRTGDYTDTSKIGHGFKRDIAGEPHRVGDMEIAFERVPDASGVQLWRMDKKAVE